MTIGRAFLSALSGLLLTAAFPNIGIHFLAWFALIPLLIAVRGQTILNGFILGAIAGIAFFAGTVHWVTNSVHYYGHIPLASASLITLLLCAYLALYPALFGAGMVILRRNYPALAFVSAPLLWTALELARTYVFTGFPWALLGYSQYAVLPAIQMADIAGVYGVSFTIVLVNAAFTELMTDWKMHPLIIAALITTAVFGYGFMRLRQPVGEDKIKVSVVQGNIDQDKKWDHVYQADTISVYKRLTLESLKGSPDIVIWPETATPFYFSGLSLSDRALTSDLVEFVKKNNVPLLFGSPTYEVKPDRTVVLRNSAIMLSGRGERDGVYHKLHLVPFGEYVPLKNVLFFVEKMVQAIGDFGPGSEYTVMTAPVVRSGRQTDMKISAPICYEIIFPDLVRRFVNRGARIIATITNDAWFGRTAAPAQHFSMAVLRAVENRVSVARAANTGVSGFIDRHGKILSSSGIFTEAIITADLTPGNGTTFYTRWGDLFAYACSAAAALLFFDYRRLFRRRVS